MTLRSGTESLVTYGESLARALDAGNASVATGREYRLTMTALLGLPADEDDNADYEALVKLVSTPSRG
jgi:hypothetical protein